MSDAREELLKVLHKTYTPADAEELVAALESFIGASSGRLRSVPKAEEPAHEEPPVHHRRPQRKS